MYEMRLDTISKFKGVDAHSQWRRGRNTRPRPVQTHLNKMEPVVSSSAGVVDIPRGTLRKQQGNHSTYKFSPRTALENDTVPLSQIAADSKLTRNCLQVYYENSDIRGCT